MTGCPKPRRGPTKTTSLEQVQCSLHKIVRSLDEENPTATRRAVRSGVCLLKSVSASGPHFSRTAYVPSYSHARQPSPVTYQTIDHQLCRVNASRNGYNKCTEKRRPWVAAEGGACPTNTLSGTEQATSPIPPVSRCAKWPHRTPLIPHASPRATLKSTHALRQETHKGTRQRDVRRQ